MSRIERISSLLKQEISQILLRRIGDSRIGFVSIVDVRVAKDLSKAWVYYSQIGDEKAKKDTLKGLKSAAAFIQSELYGVIRLQTIPTLIFRYDDSLERGVNLVNKINSLDESASS